MAGFEDVLGGAGAGGMAAGPWGALAGAGLGIGKYYLLDKPKYQRQLELAAATQRYSPWTHLTAQTPDQPDPFSNALAYGSTGASVGQGMENKAAQEAMNKKLMENMDAQSNYYRSVAAANPQNSGLNFSTVAPQFQQPISGNQAAYLKYIGGYQ